MRAIGWRVGVLLLACFAAAEAAADLKPGDMATVKRDGAQIRQGKTVLAELNKGQRVKIHYVQGGFARVWFTIKGKAKVGYMSVKDLEPPERKGKEVAQNPFAVDDVVVVIAREAKLKKGKETLGLIPEGTRLTIKKIRDQWLGVSADVKGKPTFGWVHSREVDYPSLKEKPPSDKDKEKK